MTARTTAHQPDVRQEITNLALLDPEERQDRLLDRREELSDLSNDLRKTAQRAWRRPLAGFALDIAPLFYENLLSHGGSHPEIAVDSGDYGIEDMAGIKRTRCVPGRQGRVPLPAHADSAGPKADVVCLERKRCPEDLRLHFRGQENSSLPRTAHHRSPTSNGWLASIRSLPRLAASMALFAAVLRAIMITM